MTSEREECNDSQLLKIEAVGSSQYATSPPINAGYKLLYTIPFSIWDLDNIIWDYDKSDLYNMLAYIRTYIHKKFEEDKIKIKGMCFQIGMYINRIRELTVENPHIMEPYLVEGGRFPISNHSVDTAVKELEGVLEWCTEYYAPAPAQELISIVLVQILNADCIDLDEW